MSYPLATLAARMVSVAGASFPRSLSKLDRLISQGTVPTQVVIAVLGTDPMLTAQVLAEANATSSGDITQISAAMLHIGLGSVHGLIRAAAHIPEEHRKALADCWTQANACATMTRLLATACAGRLQAHYDDETLQTAGLLHDLGTIIAILQFPAEYQRACERLEREEIPLSRLLKEELGADNAQLGTLLAHTWRLPALFTSCIRHHAQPERADGFGELVGLVHVAHILVRACGFTCGRDRFVENLSEEVLRHLDLHLYDFERLIELFLDEMDELELYEGLVGSKTGLHPTLRG
jgi:HD-like signal output (HDOD) protein